MSPEVSSKNVSNEAVFEGQRCLVALEASPSTHSLIYTALTTNNIILRTLILYI